MKKKILFVHHSGNLGGAPRSLSYLLKDINRSEVSPYLFNISTGPANNLFQENNVNPIIIKGAKPFHGSTVAPKSIKLFVKNYLFFIPTLFTAYIKIKKINPNIIHLNSTCLFVFAIAAKLWNKKIPVICHVREPLRKGFWGWPLRYFLRKFIDGFIAISRNDIASLKLPEFKKKKSTIIYNFVDNKIVPEMANVECLKRYLKIDKQRDIVFLFLARFAPGNGVNELIAMANKILQDRPNFLFLLAGWNEQFKVAKFDTNRIKLIPFHDKPQDLLALSDIFVCPFTEPHFSRGIIEASALGIPVLANDIPGIRELVKHGETGFLYNDDISFNNYGILLGDNEKRRIKMGEQALKFAKEKFNYEKNIKETYEFINSFLKNAN
jgi:glycosyltransferase involved in cell wall biosynthesis